MDQELFSLLTGAAPVADLVGPRIFWGLAPAGTPLRMLVLNIISGSDSPHLRGTDGLWRYRVQVDCYGENRPDARELSQAVVALLNGHRSGGFRSVLLEATREDLEEAAHGRPWRFSHDFIIYWRAQHA
ncbi:tail completion protein gp17 [Falsigemmobacter faecalis]|uniref:DUF3168 domain-containing protein n=1 Tax=Falsigemmobacter faecalis TaxID=2488730 RepID=A0A3P3DC50_9RHOB|nr:DUF3168 domain-containing protein [Falsigemmobacter faecalis]RRH69968.1 DUF3168 domain-containing protein [Falsigemmobacter faecalis]